METAVPSSTPLAAPWRVAPIHQAARQLGVTSRTLRHYEDKGLVRAHRLAGGVRAYDPHAFETLRTVVALREVGLPIAAIRRLMALRSDPAAQKRELGLALAMILEDRKRDVVRLQTMLDTVGSDPAQPPFADHGAGAQESREPPARSR